jgi:4-hydroxy-tetrahydrodipicolinate reductase
MGERICALARQDARFLLVAEHDVSAPLSQAIHGTFDVLVDFSSDEGTRAAAAFAEAGAVPLLVGTTGLQTATLAALDRASARCAVLVAPNTSRGVAVMGHLAVEAARLLGGSWQVDLFEQHHRRKLDAPSGTARRLLGLLRDRAGLDLPPERVHCVRAGEIIGEHELQFAGPGEVLRIEHRAGSRDLFAQGALDGAAWLAGQPPGRYTIEQSLGLAPQRSG